MTASRTVVLVVLVAVTGMTIAPIAGAAVDGFASTDDESSSMGANVSAFMQSSDAATDSSVESSLFENSYDHSNADRQHVVVENRIDQLEERYEALEAEKAALGEERGNLSETAYEARMTSLTVQLASLDRAIDGAEHRANETGVDTDRLAELRANASELSGPEVAEIASELAGVDPPGPPDHAGAHGNETGQGNNSFGQGNETPGQGNETPPGQTNGSSDDQTNIDDDVEAASDDSGSTNSGD